MRDIFYYYYYYYYYYSQNSGAPNDDFPLEALKTHLRLSRVLLIEECILNSAYINLVRRAKSEANAHTKYKIYRVMLSGEGSETGPPNDCFLKYFQLKTLL